jgi:hypothetical protein
MVVVPNGPCQVVISNVSGATVYVTTTVAATSTNGFAIPTGAPPVTFTGYPGSTGASLNVIADSGGSVTGVVSWLISTTR